MLPSSVGQEKFHLNIGLQARIESYNYLLLLLHPATICDGSTNNCSHFYRSNSGKELTANCISVWFRISFN